MGKTLIIGEIKNDKITQPSLEIASKAVSDGFDCSAVVLGNNKDAAAQLSEVGVSNITLLKSDVYSGEAISLALKEIISTGGYETVLLVHSWTGKDLAGRLSGLLDVPVISDIVEMELTGEKISGKKPVYAGKAYVNFSAKKTPQVITVRPNTFTVAEKKVEANIEEKQVDVSKDKVKLKEFKAGEGDQIELTEASIIVSGGRGVKGPEYFKDLQELADLLGAALGASRAAVDAGWIDHSHQVGQTGKTVTPNLYIAVGISGAIQHLAGMGSSKYIVAINKDKEAPIFKVANYGIVEDLFEFVPAFRAEVEKIKG